MANLVDPVVAFADPNLELAIREKLEQPSAPLTRLDVLAITELDASNRDIKRLEGIESLRRLSILNLEGNAVEDISPLAGLGMLAELNLRNNQIANLDDVNFRKITHLRLRSLNLENDIDDELGGLADVRLVGEFSQLEILNLRGNRITEINTFRSLIRLVELDLRGNLVSDIEPLRELYALKELNLRDNNIRNIEPLNDLTNLTYLNLHSNPIETGLGALSNLKALKTLIMRNVFIGDDYHFLANLQNLQKLNIRNTGITDVSVLGDLMSGGALQDDPGQGISASVDLLELDLARNNADPYFGLRRYWDNISSRYPITLPYYPGSVEPPIFSHLGGFYQQGFFLVLTTPAQGRPIFYTLDGAEPLLTPSFEPMGSTQRYTEPIWIDSRLGEPNLLSNIETSIGIEYRPPGEVFKASVVRAIALNEAGNRSNIKTQTYFVDERIATRYTFPLVSIITNNRNLFNDEIGIYIPGNLFQGKTMGDSWRYPANFIQRGLKWERPAFFQMFSPNGELILEQNVGMRIHGGATRYFNPKSFRLYASNEYDEKGLIDYAFPSDLNKNSLKNNINTYETLIFRNGGNDELRALFRDVLAQNLLSNTGLDIQEYQPVIVFINGEYWGIHNIRTRYDEHYFQARYGIAPSDLIVLENGSESVRFGNAKDITQYSSLFSLIDENYVKNHYHTVDTLSDDKAYQKISTRVDIDNFIAYHVAQIYFDNGDWPQNNILLWAKRTSPKSDANYGHDGKWRWMVLDADYTFRYPDSDRLSKLALELNQEPSTYLFRSLLENEEFRYRFINKFADSLNTIFREDVVAAAVNRMELLYSPEIEEHIHRWGNLGGSFASWSQNVNEIREFALKRPSFQRDHIIRHFGLSGSVNLTLRADPTAGYIRINTIDIREGTVGVDEPANWTGVYFKDVPVKIAAIPAPGYRFVRWQETGSVDAELTLVPTEDITLTAEFEKED